MSAEIKAVVKHAGQAVGKIDLDNLYTIEQHIKELTVQVEMLSFAFKGLSNSVRDKALREDRRHRMRVESHREYEQTRRKYKEWQEELRRCYYAVLNLHIEPNLRCAVIGCRY